MSILRESTQRKDWLISRTVFVAMNLVLVYITVTFGMGCSYYALMKPEMGITKQFPVVIVGEDSKDDPYDFEEFDYNKGLYIFSYKFIGASGFSPLDLGTGTKAVEGLRIWEHEFGSNDSNVVRVPKLIKYHYKSKGGTIATREWKYGLIAQSYQKGAIVYGGRYVIDCSMKTTIMQVEQHFDEDCGSLEAYLQAHGIDIPLVMIPMQILQDRNSQEWSQQGRLLLTDEFACHNCEHYQLVSRNHRQPRVGQFRPTRATQW